MTETIEELKEQLRYATSPNLEDGDERISELIDRLQKIKAGAGDTYIFFERCGWGSVACWMRNHKQNGEVTMRLPSQLSSHILEKVGSLGRSEDFPMQVLDYIKKLEAQCELKDAALRQWKVKDVNGNLIGQMHPLAVEAISPSKGVELAVKVRLIEELFGVTIDRLIIPKLRTVVEAGLKETRKQ